MKKKNLLEEKKKTVSNERFFIGFKIFLVVAFFLGCIIEFLFFTVNTYSMILMILIFASIIAFISED